jgi:regulation of enolase protein 1 (concanavalin A-like superfamily)
MYGPCKSYKMKCKTIFFICMVCFFLSAFHHELKAQQMNGSNDVNLLEQIKKEDLKGFLWMNPPKEFDIKDDQLQVLTSGNTDFFIDPENNKSTASAHFLFKEVKGDFITTLQVKPNFKDQWNACAILMIIDETHWIKLAFENSDATGKSIVTVVTRGISDDANGAVLNEFDTVWLKMIRKGKLFAMHWSTNGKDYYMARLAAMPDSEVVKIGLEAQSPIGTAVLHEFKFLSIEQKTVEDLRKGI